MQVLRELLEYCLQVYNNVRFTFPLAKKPGMWSCPVLNVSPFILLDNACISHTLHQIT